MSYLRTLGRAFLGRPPVAARAVGSGQLKREMKASAVGGLIARLNVGQAIWPNRDYEKLGREGYQQNPIVARSVELIASGVASIVMELHKGRGKRAKPQDDHPLLALLERPNPEQDRAEFLTQLVSHLMISGNAFAERTSEDRIERMELYALRPDRVRIIPGADGFVEGYEYNVGGAARRFAIDVDRGLRPVLHLKRFHPVDDWYGMSPLDPAGWSIDTHNAAAAFNKALLDNSATPSGAYVYKPPEGAPDTLGDDQYERLKASLEEQVQGARNAGRPLLLEGGLDWKQLGLNLENLQFVEAKNLAAREIAFTLGVPPMMLGIPGDNTYSNYQEANRAFYRQTVIPLAERLARALTHWFKEYLADDERLVLDLDSVTALEGERAELWKKLESSKMITLNEKREALGYERREGGDELYVGAGELPIGSLDEGAIAGGPEPDDTEDDTDPAAGGRGMPRERLN